MRNGNAKNVSVFIGSSNSSYPTYEEWKFEFVFCVTCVESGSYPTYEEWKLINSSMNRQRSIRSYPTYEEWKPR